jgi:hypothetical protein
VRIAGGLLFAVGALSLVATLLTRTDVDYTWADWAAPAAVMVVGVGLVLGQRWAWVFGVLAGIASVGVGFAAVRAGGDITHPGLGPIGVLFVLLGAVLLAMLLTLPTLRWFAERWLARRGK